MDYTFDFESYAFANGKPDCRAHIRTHIEDFQVKENLAFTPTEEGEHVFLNIEKTAANTRWVADKLAEFCGLKPLAIGFAGLKDRHAVATQWFSVHLPGKEPPDWGLFAPQGVRIITQARHNKKLRRGALSHNDFRIVIRNLSGNVSGLNNRASVVAAEGVPNYFGPQRFGSGGGNLAKALAMFSATVKSRKRNKHDLYYSAARSFLFNAVLSHRVATGTWRQAVPGEVLMLDGSHSIFQVDAPDEPIQRRLDTHDIHCTGPLWGVSGNIAAGEARELEIHALAPFAEFRRGLEELGLKHDRRALRVRPHNFRFEHTEPDAAVISFSLPAGGYATSVLRELFLFSDCSHS